MSVVRFGAVIEQIRLRNTIRHCERSEAISFSKARSLRCARNEPPPKFRHCERSEAISARADLKTRLLRCARKDEVHGLSTAALWLKTRNDEVHGQPL